MYDIRPPFLAVAVAVTCDPRPPCHSEEDALAGTRLLCHSEEALAER